MSDKQLPNGFEWPRFEDGAFAKPGDVMCPHSFWENEEIESIVFDDDGFNVKTTSEHIWYVPKGDRLMRPPALDKDGQEIKVGDTVYGGDGKKGDVLAVRRHTAPHVVEAEHEGKVKQLKPEWLTHERPDSWERLEEDARKGYLDYWSCRGTHCRDCPAKVGWEKPHQRYGTTGCSIAKDLDVLARAKKLAGVMGDE